MALTTEIMTAQEIINEAIPNAEFDKELINKNILKAQRQYIRDAIGEDLYTELLTQIEGNSETDDNTTLLNNYIKPTLAWFVVYLSAPYMRANITSAGFMINFTDDSEQSDFRDYSAVRQAMLHDAELGRKEMLKFLCDNATTYPLFSTAEDEYRGSNTMTIY